MEGRFGYQENNFILGQTFATTYSPRPGYVREVFPGSDPTPAEVSMPWRFTALAVVGFLLAPSSLLAAEPAPSLTVPVWWLTPFVLLLLCIAILPLAAHHWWERNSSRILVVLILSVPVVAYLGFGVEQGLTHVIHAVEEYIAFICLLGALYTISGGIVVGGRFRGTPLTNSTFLLVGAVLANFIGTTGASMLLIRPVLRINQWRRRRAHIPIFFIFVVSNFGGLLTPLGDPPLFLGLLRGVPFFWTLRLLPEWLLANGLVLAIFFVWDAVTYLREPPTVRAPSAPDSGPRLQVRGLLNLVFLLGVVAAVLLQSPDVATQLADWTGGLLPPEGMRTSSGGLSALWGAAIMAALAGLSFVFTPAARRRENNFTWAPILEVAILFLGIFITMIPALAVLRHESRALGYTEAWHYFLFTGLLSSFLDNAPTYVAFGNLAARSDDFSVLVNNLVPDMNGPLVLAAISCGAVFMGANTYIGNGPNFMVKAISDASGYRMPSFFGYMAYSVLILGPIFAAITFVFFLP
jgi:Na+/H+ antiporter NhaD/arsenite permease-like protein